MDIVSAVGKVAPAVQNLQKKAGTIATNLANVSGEKMGSWTLLGYGMGEKVAELNASLPRLREFSKPLGKINRLV